MTLNMYMAAVAWLCLVIGFLGWKRRRTHLIFVVCGIVIDVGLVLYLQVTRSAVQTALSFSLHPLQQIHIGVSTLAVEAILGRGSPWQQFLVACSARPPGGSGSRTGGGLGGRGSRRPWPTRCSTILIRF
jgi:hypothetical protein